jgi:hypothetical protein
VRVFSIAATLAALALPAFAGAPYTLPALKPANIVQPPAALRADATKLLKAVRADDLEAAGRWIGDRVTVISGTLDMGSPRTKEVLGPWQSGSSALTELGQRTGGDWDLPPNVDIGAFLSDMELDFIEGALTDGQPWGTDPMLPGTICTYGYHVFDPVAVERAAAAIGIADADFVMVPGGTELRDKPDGRGLGALAGDALYGLDYDTDAPSGWMGLHLPQGGVGFIAVGEDGLSKPYASGLCFAESAEGWQVVGQASTGL